MLFLYNVFVLFLTFFLNIGIVMLVHHSFEIFYFWMLLLSSFVSSIRMWLPPCLIISLILRSNPYSAHAVISISPWLFITSSFNFCNSPCMGTFSLLALKSFRISPHYN